MQAMRGVYTSEAGMVSSYPLVGIARQGGRCLH